MSGLETTELKRVVGVGREEANTRMNNGKLSNTGQTERRLFAYNSRRGRTELSADTPRCNSDKKPHKKESEPCKTCA